MSTMTCIKRAKLAAVLLVATAASLWAPRCSAQAVAIAEISGQVTDPAGAAISSAKIKVTETEKRLVRETVSDAEGRYVLPNLPIGPYRLDVAAPGFKNYAQTGILLQVGNSVAINVAMQLGSVSEVIEVMASAGMAETRENSVSQVIDERRITELPLNGRQPTQLILLSGAALTAPGGGMTGSKNYWSSTTISVAGGQANGVNYLLDGGDHNDSFTNVNLPLPFPDALQEFSVQTSSLPARYGLHPGGVVNAVTKSGSNQWHGSLFEFLRNGKLNARNFFTATHDTLIRNQFGGTFGGRIKPDKLFFFGGYQGTRNRELPASTKRFVPNSAVLAGDFTTLESAQCVSTVLNPTGARKLKDPRDPSGRTFFPNNQIPTSLFNRQALNLLKSIPLSNDPCGKVTYGIPTTGDEYQIIGRMDWVQSTKHSVYGRYYFTDYNNPPVFDGKNLLTTTQAGNFERVQAVTLGDTYSFTSTTLNALHATVTRRRDDRGTPPNMINPPALGINVSAPIPNMVQMSVTNYFDVGCGTCAPAHFNVNAFHLADDVDVIRGKHQMSFGVDYIRDQMNVLNNWNRNGVFNFDGSLTGDALADFLLGKMNRFTQSNTLENATRATVIALYAQDSIRLTPHLTVNAGLRWEPTFPAYDVFYRGTSFSEAAFAAGTTSKVFTKAPPGLLAYGDPGIPKAYSNAVNTNFSPRVGLVWDPSGNGRQTFRVSGAVLRDTAETFYNERLTTNTPYGTSIDLKNPAGGGVDLSNPWAVFPGGNPFPNPYPPPPNATFYPSSKYVDMPLELRPTYMVQWNASYQRQVTPNWLATITYIGNKTSHIWVSREINPAVYTRCPTGPLRGQLPTLSAACTDERRVLSLQDPAKGLGYAGIVRSDQGGNGSYHGMLLSLQHRFSHNFTLLTNYTYSHCISEVDFTGEMADNGSYPIPSNRKANRGNCNFDVRHIFNTSLVATTPGVGSGWTKRLSKNWQFAPILSARSGIAFNVTAGKDYSLTNVNQDRPNLLLSSAYSDNRSSDSWLNPKAFAPAALGTFGNFGRDVVTAPPQVNFDLSLSRIFNLTERIRMEARCDAFNAINHANFKTPGSPNTVGTNSLPNSSFGKLLDAYEPRILQFAMKVRF